MADPGPYEDLIKILDRALESPAGLSIRTKDGDKLRRRFYIATRLVRESGKPGNNRFSALTFRISPYDKNVLEIHKKPEKANAQEE